MTEVPGMCTDRTFAACIKEGHTIDSAFSEQSDATLSTSADTHAPLPIGKLPELPDRILV